MPSPDPTAGRQSETAMRAFLAEIGPARDRLFRTRPGLDPVDVADGEGFLAQLMEGALQFLQADPAEPAFVPWVTPTRRWTDNARDSEYWMAPVDGSHTYRITGRRGDECYLSFTVYAGDPGHPETVALNVNHVDLGVGSGGDFELAIEPSADACYVISRQYMCDPDRARPGTFRIHVTGGPPPTPSDDAARAARWHQAQRFIYSMTGPRAAGADRPPSYVSTTPNLMGDPAAWRHDEGGGRGTPDQTYASGPYALGEDEALVMEVRFPSAAYAGAALWNRFSQTVDPASTARRSTPQRPCAGPTARRESWSPTATRRPPTGWTRGDAAVERCCGGSCSPRTCRRQWSAGSCLSMRCRSDGERRQPSDDRAGALAQEATDSLVRRRYAVNPLAGHRRAQGTRLITDAGTPGEERCTD